MTVSFLAILRDGDETSIRQIDLSKKVHAELDAEFKRQAEAFLAFSHRLEQKSGTKKTVVEEAERIAFFPVYHLSNNAQIFEQDKFELDAEIVSAANAPDSCDSLVLNDDSIPQIRAICASYHTRSSLKMYFQSFDRRRVLTTNRWAFLQSGTTFSRLDKPGFTLGDSISAIYDDGKLLFRSYAVVARFVNLLAVFNEASTEKIETVLSHPALMVENADDVIAHADSTMRRQFAAVAELGVLDKLKPKEAKATAAQFNIDLTVGKRDGKLKVQFPPTKPAQKELLAFLTESLYLGPITGEPYQSNSHRPRKPKKLKT